MVYSVFYYASEALTRALATLVLKIYEYKSRRRMVEEKPPEAPPPSWGWFTTVNPGGVREYTWIGRSTGLRVSIPLHVEIPLEAYKSKPPVRLYFTFTEAASREWYKEIERLAELAEKGGRSA